MKRGWPLLLIVAGLLLMVGGFVYDVMFAGIPYQDPTPEMSARYAFHAHCLHHLRDRGRGFCYGLLRGHHPHDHSKTTL
jgi:hypothetical protein